jgi:hypothetical protein
MNDNDRFVITTLVVTVVLVFLKVGGIIVWPWWLVLTPIIWIPTGIAVIILSVSTAFLMTLLLAFLMITLVSSLFYIISK